MDLNFVSRPEAAHEILFCALGHDMEAALALVSATEVQSDEMLQILRTLAKRWDAYAEGCQIRVCLLSDQSFPEKFFDRYSGSADDLDPSP